MNNQSNYFEIIPDGPNKGRRLYFENLYGVEFAFPAETYFLFKNALNNYKIYFINCKPAHNIHLPENDFQFLNSYAGSETIYKNHQFSKEALELKNMQYFDIKKIYNLSISTDKIGLLIIHPKLEKEFYCFDFFIFVKDDFDLDILLKTKFDLITVHSVIEFQEQNLNIEFFQKTYDFYNFLFKDNIILFEEREKVCINNDNINLIPELIEWRRLIELQISYLSNNKVTITPYDDDFKRVSEIVETKRDQLRDMELYKCLVMRKMCCQFWIFHKDILDGSIFCTNWFQLVGGATAVAKDNKLIVDYENLHASSWLDLICNWEDNLYCIIETVYNWKKK